MKFLKIKLRKVDVSETVDEGVFLAKVAKIEKTTQTFDGNIVPRFKWGFRIIEKKFAGRMLWLRTGVEATPKNKLGKLLVTLMGKNVDFEEEGEIDTNDLYGKKCKIIVKHSEQLKDDGTPWENISDVLKYKGKEDDEESDDEDEEEESSKSKKVKDDEDEEEESSKSKKVKDDEDEDEDDEEINIVQKKFNKLDEETQKKIMKIVKLLKDGEKVSSEKIELIYKKLKLDISDYDKPKSELKKLKFEDDVDEIEIDEI